MNLDYFVEKMRVLESKYGRDKITPQLVNDVWREIKTFDDSYIAKRVEHLMVTKSTWGDKFSVLDFTGPRVDLIDEPVDEKIEEQKKPIKRRLYMTHQLYKPGEKVEKKPEHLKKCLADFGANNVLEALKIAKQRGNNGENNQG